MHVPFDAGIESSKTQGPHTAAHVPKHLGSCLFVYLVVLWRGGHGLVVLAPPSPICQACTILMSPASKVSSFVHCCSLLLTADQTSGKSKHDTGYSQIPVIKCSNVRPETALGL